MENLLQKKLSIQQILNSSQKIPLRIFRKFSTTDLASFLLELEKGQADKLFQELLESKLAVSVLSEMKEPYLKTFLKNLTRKQLTNLFSQGPMDDLVYLMNFIEKKEKLLQKLSPQQRITLKKFMDYPQDTAGRIMQDDFFSLPLDFSAEQGIQKLREFSRHRFVHYIYATDSKRKLLGVLSIRQLAIASPHTKIENIANKTLITVSPQQNTKEVAEIVSRHNYIAIPVVDEEQKMLGLITVDDILDIVEEQATAQIYAMAGLPEDDRIYTTLLPTIKNRLPWLGLNLLFAIAASSIISLFEQTMSRLIILATLKNIVAGIGGNTAIQTLTVTTRGLDTGDFHFTSSTKALIKEVSAGFIMGVFMGLGAGIITYIWKNSFLVSVVIFISMIINSLLATFVGFTIPIFMRKMGKDPAISSGVLVTIITDIFGFFIFLGTAYLGLQLVGESL